MQEEPFARALNMQLVALESGYSAEEKDTLIGGGSHRSAFVTNPENGNKRMKYLKLLIGFITIVVFLILPLISYSDTEFKHCAGILYNKAQYDWLLKLVEAQELPVEQFQTVCNNVTPGRSIIREKTSQGTVTRNDIGIIAFLVQIKGSDCFRYKTYVLFNGYEGIAVPTKKWQSALDKAFRSEEVHPIWDGLVLKGYIVKEDKEPSNEGELWQYYLCYNIDFPHIFGKEKVIKAIPYLQVHETNQTITTYAGATFYFRFLIIE